LSFLNRNLVWLFAGVCVIAALVTFVQAGMDPAGSAIIIQWSTASELNTAGFNVYRGDTPDGPFTKLNADLIPGSTDPLVGGSYAYTDTSAIVGHTYYYQLEDVETSGGAATRHDTKAVYANDERPIYYLVSALLIVIALILAVSELRPRRSVPHD
jgi:hypothetical protein